MPSNPPARGHPNLLTNGSARTYPAGYRPVEKSWPSAHLQATLRQAGEDCPFLSRSARPEVSSMTCNRTRTARYVIIGALPLKHSKPHDLE
jgi:hypothetical protein